MRILLLAAAALSCLQVPVFADQESVTPDQVVARYLAAIGGEHYSSITTFIERGEIRNIITNSNIANLGRLSATPPLQQFERYEYYFKSPNFRLRSTISENNQVVGLHGCDGKVTWYIDPSLKRQEFTPKPGQEYDCEKGFESLPQRLRDANAKFRLAGEKKIAGRMTWEVKVDVPKSHWPETFFFDEETGLLSRVAQRNTTLTYSDYRDVGGVKRAFTVVREDSNFRSTITVREVQINVPIDDSRFAEPQLKNGMISLNPILPPKMDEAKDAAPSPPKTTEPGPVSSSTEINFPNFTICSIPELQRFVPELRGLQPASDQAGLTPLLEKIGTKLLDTARHTPNLISREAVTDSAKGAADKRQDYDYLILTRIEGSEVQLNEFRVDLKTGEKFQTFDVEPSSRVAEPGAPFETTGSGRQATAPETGQHPLSQGFASSWVYFYPHNWTQSAFRYLGEQKLDSRGSVVVAFAQKPQAVSSPGLFRYQGRSTPMYFQGVAWFDTSDFRILRIRTELLAPLPEVSLQQLSADIRFMEIRIPNVSSILFLPRDVTVTSVVSGGTLRERHSYSDYRLFRAQSKILLDP